MILPKVYKKIDVSETCESIDTESLSHLGLLTLLQAG
jgi:hypothetical protein